MVVLFLLLGLVQYIKTAVGLEGRAVELLTLVLGFILFGIAYGINEGLLPEAITPYIEWVVFALAAPLSAMGYYKLVKSPNSGGGGNA